MTALFYILGYLAVVGFIVLVCMKLREYRAASPLHVRWELYPVPHEGARARHGGSFMEETEWWTRPRHVEHIYDILGIFREVLLLEATFEHNRPLWFRTYPFHFGLFMLMGGTIILVLTVLAEFCGISPHAGFMVFIANVLNAVVLIGALGIVGGGLALIHRRMTDFGLRKYTTPEHYLNLGGFVLFGLLTLAAWAFNPDPSYYELAHDFISNLLTFSFEPQKSTLFALNMLVGFCLLIWIPLTNMQHLILKYFMYHDIRWGDLPCNYSKPNREKVKAMLQYRVTWAAPHIGGEDGAKTWLDVATSWPDGAAQDKK